MEIYEVTNNTLPKDKLYILDFYATWCNPCKMLSKVLEDMTNDVPVYKVNIEENTELAQKYGVRGVPTLATDSWKIKCYHIHLYYNQITYLKCRL